MARRGSGETAEQAANLPSNFSGNTSLRLTVHLLAVLVLSCRAVLSTEERLEANLLTFWGTADASAAALVDADYMLVGNDEDNTLRLYKLDQPGFPIQQFVWDAHLDLDPKQPSEADIEAAARVDGRIYWIGSHGRASSGKWRPNRQRFFATDIATVSNRVVMKPVGIPCRNLLWHLLRDDRYAGLGLAEAVAPDTPESPALAPKRGGINIEGLAAAKDGKGLLIGFRNPRPQNKALIVPFLNPDAVLMAGSTSATFGPPILLDLRGRGIRDLTYSPRHQVYLIIAGPSDEAKDFDLYRWSGAPDDNPVVVENCGFRDVSGFTPEAILAFPDRDAVLVLSDDGSLPAEEDGKGWQKKKLAQRRVAKHFRALWVEMPQRPTR